MNITYELHLLRRRFPAITVWFGQATHHYWALVDDRLIEANTALKLADAIRGAQAGPVPHPGHRAIPPVAARAYGGGTRRRSADPKPIS
ncbi:hypothetical protein [Actinomadura alba]|uniref:Uncharacterized protein n=1 Tax=Actinomadura alba TaxID=406431 RepID=A0ABR7M2S3_9ACTN|nr:hypothetical protein [Actinomadura alba]MBC6471213.1 hypothetical protein [Actinomadura alba]